TILPRESRDRPRRPVPSLTALRQKAEREGFVVTGGGTPLSPRARRRRKRKPVKVTPAAADYAAAELRWPAHLRRTTSPKRPVPYSYEIMRAKIARARLRAALAGSDASIEGQEDEDRYSQAEIDALGERGLAFKRADGVWDYPCVDRRDLLNI